MAVSLEHPYPDPDDAGHWLRGNLHTHTTRSDGKRDPQTVIDDYAARGYHFLMISDHDVLTAPADYAAWDSRGMLLIPGNEISARGPHLLHVGASRRIDPFPQRQEALNAARNDPGSFLIAAHPNWQEAFDHTTIAQLREWTGYAGLEIYNGVISRLPGSPYATNKWDMLLAQGRRVWGYANDDSHRDVDVEQGWNVVWVAQRTAEAVVESLRTGRFYASTGVTIDRIEVRGSRIRVAASNAHRIAAMGAFGKRVAQVDAPELEVDAESFPDHRYIRFELWGVGERQAWTQPFFITT
ncbi:MAG TPA: CehA/McbA family metallohydrolase [Phycisphaeraceae bacterium]